MAVPEYKSDGERFHRLMMADKNPPPFMINVDQSRASSAAPTTLGTHIFRASAVVTAIFAALAGVLFGVTGLITLFSNGHWMLGTLALMGALSIMIGVSLYVALES